MSHGWMMVMADLHGRLPELWRPVDAVVIAGDICPDFHDIPRTIDLQRKHLDGPLRAWLKKMGVPVIATPGNHDRIFADPDAVPKGLEWHLLVDSGCEVNGLKFWGAPWDLGGSMAFGVPNDTEADDHWRKIPRGTDVVVTHNPPLGYGDKSSIHRGSRTLRVRVRDADAQLHLFGHCHEGRGHWAEPGIYRVNCTLGAGCGGSGAPVPAPHGTWGLADDSWRRR